MFGVPEPGLFSFLSSQNFYIKGLPQSQNWETYQITADIMLPQIFFLFTLAAGLGSPNPVDFSASLHEGAAKGLVGYKRDTGLPPLMKGGWVPSTREDHKFIGWPKAMRCTYDRDSRQPQDETIEGNDLKAIISRGAYVLDGVHFRT